MKMMLQAIAFLAFLPICVAQEFFLADPSGNKFGPFHFEHGENIKVGGTNYSVFIPTVVEDQNAVVRKMKKIILPHVDFRQANINDVMMYLQAASVEYDTGPEPKGVSPVLSLGATSAPSDQDDTPADPVRAAGSVPLITFSARSISLFDALNIVCRVAGIGWEVSGKSILFVPKKTEKVQQPSLGDVLKAAPDK